MFERLYRPSSVSDFKKPSFLSKFSFVILRQFLTILKSSRINLDHQEIDQQNHSIIVQSCDLRLSKEQTCRKLFLATVRIKSEYIRSENLKRVKFTIFSVPYCFCSQSSCILFVQILSWNFEQRVFFLSISLSQPGSLPHVYRFPF